MKNYLRNLGLFVGVIALATFAHFAYATGTPSSAQGPQFVGPPSVPSLVFRTDAGSTGQVGPVKVYTFINLDGGNGDQGIVAADQVGTSTAFLCQVSQPNLVTNAASGAIAQGYAGLACTVAVIQPTGGDAGYGLVNCGWPWLGTDGGQATCVRFN
jgi:hypothetical protein